MHQYMLLTALFIVTQPEYMEKTAMAQKDQEWAEKIKKAAEKSSQMMNDAVEKIKKFNEDVENGRESKTTINN